MKYKSDLTKAELEKMSEDELKEQLMAYPDSDEYKKLLSDARRNVKNARNSYEEALKNYKTAEEVAHSSLLPLPDRIKAAQILNNFKIILTEKEKLLKECETALNNVKNTLRFSLDNLNELDAGE